MTIRAALAFTLCLLYSFAAMAAKPSSIIFKETSSNNKGAQYQLYVVKCSNGEQREITSWNNRKLWCVGDAIREGECEKNQINAARRVCEGT